MVYDGCGIAPDVEVKQQEYAKVTRELVMKDMVFDFVNEYAVTHPTVETPMRFEVTGEMYAEFKTFLRKRGFEYETASRLSLAKLEEAVKAEKYQEQVDRQLKELKKLLEHSIDRDLDAFRDEVSRVLADQFMERYYMQEGSIEFLTRYDPEILKAREILANEKIYRDFLPGQTHLN